MTEKHIPKENLSTFEADAVALFVEGNVVGYPGPRVVRLEVQKPMFDYGEWMVTLWAEFAGRVHRSSGKAGSKAEAHLEAACSMMEKWNQHEASEIRSKVLLEIST